MNNNSNNIAGHNCQTCFALMGFDGAIPRCSALSECNDKPGAPCGFFKTSEQLEASRHACYDRLVNNGLFTGSYEQYLQGAARRL